MLSRASYSDVEMGEEKRVLQKNDYHPMGSFLIDSYDEAKDKAMHQYLMEELLEGDQDTDKDRPVDQ